MSKRRAEWEKHCLRWRGRILSGKHAHSCPDWDELPIDETCPEWPCICYRAQGPKRGFGDAVSDDDDGIMAR